MQAQARAHVTLAARTPAGSIANMEVWTRRRPIASPTSPRSFAAEPRRHAAQSARTSCATPVIRCIPRDCLLCDLSHAAMSDDAAASAPAQDISLDDTAQANALDQGKLRCIQRLRTQLATTPTPWVTCPFFRASKASGPTTTELT